MSAMPSQTILPVPDLKDTFTYKHAKLICLKARNETKYKKFYFDTASQLLKAVVLLLEDRYYADGKTLAKDDVNEYLSVRPILKLIDDKQGPPNGLRYLKNYLKQLPGMSQLRQADINNEAEKDHKYYVDIMLKILAFDINEEDILRPIDDDHRWLLSVDERGH